MNRLPVSALILAVAVGIAALGGDNLAPRGTSAAGPQGSPAASQPAPTSASTPVTYVGQVTLEPSRGPAGTEVTITGTGLDPNAQLTVNWNTVRGAWVLKGEANEEFH